jgi:hypothetical protein
VYGDLSPSSMRNSTFRKINSLNSSMLGGVLYINSPNNYPTFTIFGCIFGLCVGANSGGALYIYNQYIQIIRTRFEGNRATYGNDIYCNDYTCMNEVVVNCLARSTCSLSPWEKERIYCNGFYTAQQQNSCSEDIVFNFFFFFYFFFFFFLPFLIHTHHYFYIFIFHLLFPFFIFSFLFYLFYSFFFLFFFFFFFFFFFLFLFVLNTVYVEKHHFR